MNFFSYTERAVALTGIMFQNNLFEFLWQYRSLIALVCLVALVIFFLKIAFGRGWDLGISLGLVTVLSFSLGGPFFQNSLILKPPSKKIISSLLTDDQIKTAQEAINRSVKAMGLSYSPEGEIEVKAHVMFSLPIALIDRVVYYSSLGLVEAVSRQHVFSVIPNFTLFMSQLVAASEDAINQINDRQARKEAANALSRLKENISTMMSSGEGGCMGMVAKAVMFCTPEEKEENKDFASDLYQFITGNSSDAGAYEFFSKKYEEKYCPSAPDDLVLTCGAQYSSRSYNVVGKAKDNIQKLADIFQTHLPFGTPWMWESALGEMVQVLMEKSAKDETRPLPTFGRTTEEQSAWFTYSLSQGLAPIMKFLAELKGGIWERAKAEVFIGYVPYFQAYLSAFLYCIFPFFFLTLPLPGGWMRLLKYFMLIFWVRSWNFFMMLASAFIDYLTFTFAHLSEIYDFGSVLTGLDWFAATLMLGVPFVSYSVIFGQAPWGLLRMDFTPRLIDLWRYVPRPGPSGPGG